MASALSPVSELPAELRMTGIPFRWPGQTSPVNTTAPEVAAAGQKPRAIALLARGVGQRRKRQAGLMLRSVLCRHEMSSAAIAPRAPSTASRYWSRKNPRSSGGSWSKAASRALVARGLEPGPDGLEPGAGGLEPRPDGRDMTALSGRCGAFSSDASAIRVRRSGA
jgi:hypothetical protein